MKPHVAVVGAGIIGLVQASLLAQRGYPVTVFSDQQPWQTTTMAAGAIWMPYKIGDEAATLRWAECSLAYYRRLSAVPHSGVKLRTHHACFDEQTIRPLWMQLLDEGDKPHCMVPEHVVSRHSAMLPVMEPVQLVTYLLSVLSAHSVPLIFQKITSPAQLSAYRIIVNASGLGARSLANDISVYAIKGQTFTLTQPAEPVTHSVFYQQKDLLTLIVPHERHVTIGVTVLEHDESTSYDDIAEQPLRRSVTNFYPQLAQSTVIDRRVGHRPGRISGIRVEAEYLETYDQWLFHNYGHAGGGLTLAPGCAHEIVNNIESL